MGSSHVTKHCMVACICHWVFQHPKSVDLQEQHPPPESPGQVDLTGRDDRRDVQTGLPSCLQLERPVGDGWDLCGILDSSQCYPNHHGWFVANLHEQHTGVSRCMSLFPMSLVVVSSFPSFTKDKKHHFGHVSPSFSSMSLAPFSLHSQQHSLFHHSGRELQQRRIRTRPIGTGRIGRIGRGTRRGRGTPEPPWTPEETESPTATAVEAEGKRRFCSGGEVEVDVDEVEVFDDYLGGSPTRII